MRDSTLKWLTAGILMGLLWPGLAWGQAFEVTPGATSAQEQPAIAALPNLNQFLVVWQDFEDISGQIVNGDGSLTGGKILISTAAGIQTVPAVAYNSTTNQFLVVWQDFQGGTLFDISGQLVNADGILSGTKITISNTANNQTAPAVAYNSTSNQFLAVWQHDSAAATLLDISGRLVNANGTLFGITEIPISTAAGDQTLPAVAYNSNPANNQFLVVWQDRRGGAFFDIFGRLINADGSLAPTEITISNDADDQTAPAVAYNSTSNQFLVAWQDRRSGGLFDIFGQRVNADGTLVAGGNFVIRSTPPLSDRAAPALAFNTNATSSSWCGKTHRGALLLTSSGRWRLEAARPHHQR